MLKISWISQPEDKNLSRLEDLSTLSLGKQPGAPEVGEILHTASDLFRALPQGLLHPVTSLASKAVSEQISESLVFVFGKFFLGRFVGLKHPLLAFLEGLAKVE